MSDLNVCCTPVSPVMEYAAIWLRGAGVTVTEVPTPETTHFLLPVPTRCFDTLPENVVIVGGNLHCLPGYTVIDLLKDPQYLVENAAITARCAMGFITGSSVLILGWGRIGKCLGQFLRESGTEVTIAARKESDVAMIRALGYGGVFFHEVPPLLPQFGAIVNTVPAMVLSVAGCRKDCVLLELASKPGMIGENIIDGRGLPGRLAPEESGQLIARTVLRLCKEDGI